MLASPPLPLLVLAGGHSRRMGRDKAAMEWEGTPLLLRVIGRLAPIASGVWVAARPGQALPAGDYRRIDDALPGEGPLAGLSRGLGAIARDGGAASPVAVAACDYPYADPALFPALVAAASTAAAIVPLLDGRAHPLLAIWRSDLATACERALERGARRVREVLDEVDAVELDARVLIGDAAERIFQNVNDPETARRALGPRD
ncbi:MAG TPA: molybdenum cofactor guanylyltransferase [Gemmatimonadota bacterium]|nr:molybdenum cofactor guanylyltransferase [Gemmatimonadota bacterium]